MKVHGKIYYSGFAYDNDGHTDDYDLIFASDDGHTELCLNGFEDAVFPDYAKTLQEKHAWASPISVHDSITGILEITFTKERVNENARV